MGDWGSGNTRDFSIPGYVPAKGEDKSVVTDFDGPDFFRTTGIRIQQGRDFASSDNDNAPKVAVINEIFAKKYFANENPIGRRFGLSDAGTSDIEIVGVAKAARYNSRFRMNLA